MPLPFPVGCAPGPLPVIWLLKDEKGRRGFPLEFLQVLSVGFENPLDPPGRAIATSYVDHFGRRPEKKAALVKIRVLGDDREPWSAA